MDDLRAAIRLLNDQERRMLRDRIIAGAFERDRDQCQARLKVPHVQCGGERDPHEIIPRSAWKWGIYVLDNVIVVCRRHHRWIDANPDDAEAVGLHGRSWQVPT